MTQSFFAVSGALVFAAVAPALSLSLKWQTRFVGLRRAYGMFYLRAALDAAVMSFSLGSLAWLVGKRTSLGSWDELTGQLWGAAIVMAPVSLLSAARWLNGMAEESEVPPRVRRVLSRPAEIDESLAALAIIAATLILAAGMPGESILPVLISMGFIVAVEFLAVYAFTVLSLPVTEVELSGDLA